MRVFRFLLGLTVFICGSVYADAVVTVLGIPLGGKLPYQVKICPSNADGLKEFCWTEKPGPVENGGDVKGGYLRVPNSDALPKWAVNGKFWVYVSKEGEFNGLNVYIDYAIDGRTIEQSITQRFGLPAKTTTTRSGLQSYWDRPNDIQIDLECGEGYCTVRFRSLRVVRGYKEHEAEIRKKDASRPVSP